MAKNKNKGLIKSLNMKSINQTLDFIQQGMDDLHRDTYANSPINKHDLDKVTDDIDNTINNLVSFGNTNDNISNISKLFSNRKIIGDINDDKFKNNIASILGEGGSNDVILKQFLQDKSIVERDRQIDLLCTYMPKLEDAIQTKLDNILSADHFSKEFITVTNMTSANDVTINSKIATLKNRYNLYERVDKWVYNACKYGEEFVYIVPYNKAITRVLNQRKSSTQFTHESTIVADVEYKEVETKNTTTSVALEIDKSGYIKEFYDEYDIVEKSKDNINLSLHESFFNIDEEAKNDISISDKIKDISLKMPSEISNDGLITKDDIVKENDIRINGAIIKELDRSKVKPLYVEDICLGYYYIETSYEENFTTNITGNLTTNMRGGIFSGLHSNTTIDKNTEIINKLLNNLSEKISKDIDASFINKNADLRNELYLILKYAYDNNNDINKIKVTYIPPDDIVHIYFKKDPITHRGISDLEKSIIPATLYCTLYLSDTLGILTRGQDKRVFYVKQTVDTNISANLMNVINQVKKSNFNVRSLNNLYNVLNVLGRYNDYFIPLSKGGDSPVQIETMQGQNIEIKQDLYELLESLALSPTDVSREMLEARNALDYAIQYTMSNSKFLRKMLKRQSTLTPKLSIATSNIYSYHFNDKVTLKVSLPAPQILNINNINQMMQTNEEFAQKIIDNECPEAEDGLKNKIKRNISRYILSTHVPYDIIDGIIESSKVEYEAMSDKNADEE